MPIYEYQCPKCGKVVEDMCSIADSQKPITQPCIDDPTGPSIGIDCTFQRILSATPTTFRFNDFTGYGGLDKTRRMHGPVRHKKGAV